jgi:hypothetical protein
MADGDSDGRFEQVIPDEEFVAGPLDESSETDDGLEVEDEDGDGAEVEDDEERIGEI